MTSSTRADEPRRDQPQERYPVGYHEEVVDFFSGRSAETQAAFLLPHLRPGVRLLDCGCGPGTITVGLAAVVSPGQVVGVDVEPAQIDAARARAARLGLGNVRFEVASAYDLPFPDASLDAVFMHGVLEHLREPVRALKEAHRVLAAGGVVGLRHAVLGGHLLWPSDQQVEEFFRLYGLVSRAGGGDPEFGSGQVGCLLEAGFGRPIPSASYDCWTSDAEMTSRSAAMIAGFLSRSAMADRAVELGLADREGLRRSAEAALGWGRNPAAFAAEAWCEAVAWKE